MAAVRLLPVFHVSQSIALSIPDNDPPTLLWICITPMYRDWVHIVLSREGSQDDTTAESLIVICRTFVLVSSIDCRSHISLLDSARLAQVRTVSELLPLMLMMLKMVVG